MTSQEIIEGNKLLAEFMGFINPYSNAYQCCFNKINTTCAPCHMLFHSSFDWLMEVVEKIELLGYRWEIGMSATTAHSHYCRIWSIGTIEGISPLDAIYGACLVFIKWYNQNRVITAKPCPNCNETEQPCACMRNICHKCGKPVGNITFTVCDDCWNENR